ncbi:MAG: hypothetical protein N4A47_00610 [Clostridia bacterium]|jgi:hypothetical protein|nr:hypothetical protein [Clostridia bacterium]
MCDVKKICKEYEGNPEAAADAIIREDNLDRLYEIGMEVVSLMNQKKITDVNKGIALAAKNGAITLDEITEAFGFDIGNDLCICSTKSELKETVYMPVTPGFGINPSIAKEYSNDL